MDGNKKIKNMETKNILKIVEKFFQKEKDNLSELEKTILVDWLCDITPALVGETGVGKTEKIRQLTNKIGLQLIEIETPNLSEAEAGLLPLLDEADKEKGTFRYAIPYWAYGDMPRIIFLDEFNRPATQDVFNSLMNFVLAKKIGDYQATNCLVVVAMNPPSDEGDYNVKNLDAAQRRRFDFIRVNPTIDEVKSYLLNKYNFHDKVEAIFNIFNYYKELHGHHPFMKKFGDNLLSPAMIENMIKQYLKGGEDFLVSYIKRNLDSSLATCAREYLNKNMITIEQFSKGWEAVKSLPYQTVTEFIRNNLVKHPKVFDQVLEHDFDKFPPEILSGIWDIIDKNLVKLSKYKNILRVYEKFIRFEGGE